MALVKSENKGINQVEVEVSIDAKTFDEACNQAYRKNVKKIVLPGFRAGKAPRKMIEKRFGESVFFDEAIEILYPKALQEAVDEAKLDVVGIESIEPQDASLEKGVTLKAVCITKPEVEIKDYKGMKVKKDVKTVTEKQIKEELENLRKRNGRTIAVEDRAAQTGDVVVIDFDGYVDGEPFEGGKAEKHTLELGSGQFIPGFEEQIEGRKLQEEFDVNVTFPEDYHAEDLKGKKSVFKCKLHEIKTVELPELDDEFAKDISEFDTLAEYKADLKEKMKEDSEKAADAEMENQLSEGLIGLMKAEVPEMMFEQRVDDLLRDFANRLQSQGMTLELYMQYTGMDKDALRGQFLEQAKKQVKLRLALEKIVELEKLSISDEEVEKEFEKMAEQYQMDVKKLKGFVQADDLKKDMVVERAMKLVQDNAKIDAKAKTTSAAKKAAPKKEADGTANEATVTKKTTAADKKTTTAAVKKTTSTEKKATPNKTTSAKKK